MSDLGDLWDKLSICNTKLYNVCNAKALAVKNPNDYTKEDLLSIMHDDIELCKKRASLKNEINRLIGQAVIEGKIEVLNEVKTYG